uniref:Major facilitator superfamily (MFS) profile domain-containing protein n=1 Tax=Tetradesmus obliquus TaxID=3088 RepID=A0A383VJ39_TETOB|eukprot:jgi/Sobl393_1/4148/SZX65538.1
MASSSSPLPNRQHLTEINEAAKAAAASAGAGCAAPSGSQHKAHNQTPSAAVTGAAAAAATRAPLPAAPAAVQEAQHPDDAPMTPVVYLVLWTSIAVGVLRGYMLSNTVAARQTPSYTYTFSGLPQAFILAKISAFCATGIDGLPGLSWYETVIESLPLLAALLAAGFVQSRGRKMGVALGCVMAIVGQVLLAAAVHVVMLYVGAAVSRSASDILYLSTGLQVVEVAPRTSRGRFLMGHHLGVAFGTVLSAVLGFFIADQGALGWRLLFGVAVLPAAAVLVVVPWLYETPHSLIQRHKYADGWAALREVRGPFYDAYPEFQAIVAASAAVPHSASMYKQLLSKPVHRPAIIAGVLMALLSALLNPMSMTYVCYTSLRLGGAGLRWAVFMSSISMAGAYALGIVLASLIIDRAGRLILLRCSSGLAIATLAVLVGLSGFHATEAGHSFKTLQPWAWLQLAVLSVLSFANGVAWSSASWVIIMESQALSIRPAGVALCISFAGAGAALIETKLLCKLSWYYYIVLLAVSLASLFISMFLVPETSKVPLEDITELWLHHKLWSKLVKPKKQPQPAAQRSAAASSASQQLGTAFRAAAAAVRHPGVGVFERQHGSLQLEQTLSGGAVDKLAAELQQHSGHRL